MEVDDQARSRPTRRSWRGQLRAWVDEPPVTPAPGPTPLDAVIVLAAWIGAGIDVALRTDLVWPAAAVVVAVLTAALVPWRRRFPLATVCAAFGMTTLFTILSASEDEPFGSYAMVAVLLLPYALFRWGSGRDTLIGLAVMLASWAVSIVADWTTAGDAIGGFVFLLLPAAIGALVRARTIIRVEQQHRARALERERLARELHDTVAHHMSAVAVQAQAGRTLAATRPDAAVEALVVIEEAASRSLEDLRAMVRSLRAEEVDGAPALAPQAGLAALEDLVEIERPGLTVDLRIDGPVSAVPDTVGGALHRIAQESLTNVTRHATAATHADVVVVIESAHGSRDSDRGRPQRVVLTIEDDGAPSGASRRGAPGFGIVGMRERAELLGGRLEAGPRSDGGWSVRCVLPIGEAR